MALGALKVLINTAQRRLAKKRISVTVAGIEFDGPVWGDAWIAPTCNVLMLRPSPLDPTWHTSNSGRFARMSLGDFGLTAGTDGWETHGNKDGLTTRLQNLQGMTASVISTAALAEKNRGLFVSYFSFGVGNSDAAVDADCGWGSTGDYTDGVSLRFWQGGKIEVWRYGSKSGEYSGGGQVADTYNEFLLIPMRRRELLIYNITANSAIVHVFDEIAENDPDPEIVPATNVWFFRPSGTVDVEMAALTFASSGYVTSLEVALAEAPAGDRVFEQWDNLVFPDVTNGRVFGDRAYTNDGTSVDLSLVEIDGSTAFVADGVLQDCRVKVELTGVEGYTPFVNGCYMAFSPVYADTVGSESTDLAPWLCEASLEVPDDPGGVQIRCAVWNPEEVNSYCPGFLELDDQPAQVWLGDVLLIDGSKGTTKFTDDTQPAICRGEFVIRDRMFHLQQSTWRERFPLSGLLLSTSDDETKCAVREFYESAGLEDLLLDDAAYTIGDTPPADATEWSDLVKVGDNSFDRLRELHDDLATSWLWGIRPDIDGPKGLFLDVDLLSTEPDVTLYRTVEDAILDGIDPAEADDYTYTSYHQEPLAIEANEVRVTGFDPRTRKAIQKYSLDEDSQDPTIAPSSRTSTWIGGPRVFGLISPRLTSEEACERAVDFIFPQVSSRYYVGEWGTTAMLVLPSGAPVWRGHQIRLSGRNDLRVSSLSVRFLRESVGDPLIVRECTYTGGTLTNAGGLGLARIKANHALRARDKSLDRSGGWLGSLQVRYAVLV